MYISLVFSPHAHFNTHIIWKHKHIKDTQVSIYSCYQQCSLLFHSRREAKISMRAKYFIPVAEVWCKIGVGFLMVHIVFAGPSVDAKRYQT